MHDTAPLREPPLCQALGEGLRRVLVVQHVAYEPLGTLDRMLRQRKIRIRYVNFAREPEARPCLEGYDALIVLGGPMNVGDQAHCPHLRTELALIDEGLRRGTPMLGICLGAQLLAHALGAPVGRNDHKELGWHEVRLTDAGVRDPVLGRLRAAEPIFHWHGDTFAIPSGAEHLAESDLCPRQAFRFGDQVYGLQFHLEVDPHLVERWLRVHQQELALVRGAESAERIRAETRAWIGGSMAASDALFGALLARFGWRERPLVLGHQPVPPRR